LNPLFQVAEMWTVSVNYAGWQLEISISLSPLQLFQSKAFTILYSLQTFSPDYCDILGVSWAKTEHMGNKCFNKRKFACQQ